MNLPQNILSSIAPSKISYNEPMNRHTAIGTGGNASVIIAPDNLSELCFIIQELRKLKNYTVIGNGCNILVSDKGYNGIVIKTTNIKGIERYGDYLTVFSGECLQDVAAAAYKEGLTGMEWAAANKGTLGGILSTSNSRSKADINDNIYIAEIITKDGEILVFNKDKPAVPGYREPAIKKTDTVLRAILRLERGDVPLIADQMKEYKEAAKMPKGKKCIGEVFSISNSSISVSELITECGLAKKRVGGASVYSTNANYIINDKSALSSDVYTLIKDITLCVFEKKGLQLRHNMHLIGKF